MFAKQLKWSERTKRWSHMFLGTLGTSLLANVLAGKGIVTGKDKVVWAGEGKNRAG